MNAQWYTVMTFAYLKQKSTYCFKSFVKVAICNVNHVYVQGSSPYVTIANEHEWVIVCIKTPK